MVMAKEKANRNKTISLSEEERSLFINILNTESEQFSRGDYSDKIICGDFFSNIQLLPDAFADLIIVDPPYNLNKDFGGIINFKSLSDAKYRDYLETWLSLVVSKLKSDGTLYLCGDWKCSAALFDVLSQHLTIINRITWQREKGRGSLSNWKNSMEDIFFAVRDVKHYYFNLDAVKMKRKVIAPYRKDGKPKDWEETSDGNFRLTCPSNFWDDISVPYWSMAENTEHPTQKPEKLIAKLILASCPKEGMVFDPFLGSGTTAVVAKKLGRHYCGIEMNEEYCCYAEKRLAMADDDKSIQGYTDGVFWERNTSNLIKATRNLE